jgi:hypothetical protein
MMGPWFGEFVYLSVDARILQTPAAGVKAFFRARSGHVPKSMSIVPDAKRAAVPFPPPRTDTESVPLPKQRNPI